jgi:tight adherence protein B
MLTALIVATGLALGASPLRLVLAWSAWQAPMPFAMAMAASSATSFLAGRRRTREPEEAVVLRRAAAELKAGKSLRMALLAAAQGSSLDLGRAVRLGVAGRPLAEVAVALAPAMKGGQAVAAAVRVAATTGGRVSEVFDRLAVMASEEAALRRERRVLTAQARLSAGIVGGFPLVFVFWLALGGGLARLIELGPVGLWVTVVGLGFLLSGIVVVLALLWKAER